MAYIGKSPTGTGVRSRYHYTAAGSETSLSGADDNNKTLTFTDGEYVDVYVNGVLLFDGDYNTNTANTISGLSALAADDVVEVVVYDVFTVADTVSAKDGGTFSGDVKFPDNTKALFGTGSGDLQIYHDGSNSYVRDDGTGDLLVQGTQIKLQDASGNDYLRGFTGGAVYLHHAGNTKFETTSGGVDVTGTAKADEFVADSAGSLSNDQFMMDFSAPAGRLRVKNSSGSPAANMEFHTTDTNGTTYKRMVINYQGNLQFYDEDNTVIFKIDETGGITAMSEGGTANKINLRQGSAKCWLNYQQYTSGNVRDSYNISSVTDNGEGDFTATINNNMNNVNYMWSSGGQRGDNAAEDFGMQAYRNAYLTAHATGSTRLVTFFASIASQKDMIASMVSWHGDLA